MAKGSNRYKIVEQYVTYGLIADGAVFLLYLLFFSKIFQKRHKIFVSGAH